MNCSGAVYNVWDKISLIFCQSDKWIAGSCVTLDPQDTFPYIYSAKYNEIIETLFDLLRLSLYSIFTISYIGDMTRKLGLYM